MKIVQEALDHEDIKTTPEAYAHILEREHTDAIERLAQELPGPRDAIRGA
jgi:integrase